MIYHRGILLYTPDDAARNRWFIEQLCLYAESEGLSLRLCLVDGENPHSLLTAHMDANFLINRSRFSSYSIYARDVLRIPCFNRAYVTAVTNDKYLTYQELHQEFGIPMAKTSLFSKDESMRNLQFPLVAKPADGHGGKDVAWIADKAELERYAASFHSAYPFLVQEPVVTGWDVRIYVLGGEIYAAVLRTSNRDFRSNFSLGGRAELIEPDPQMRALVQRIHTVMPLDFAGVDLLKKANGDYILGEIEDAVGCRMLYQLTNLNPAQDYIRYIRSRLS